MSAILRPRFLFFCHYSQYAGHLGDRGMYETRRCDLYWPHMTRDDFVIVRNCYSSAQNRRTGKEKRNVCLFLPSRQSMYVAMDILRPFPRTKFDNQLTVMMMHHYSKLTKAILTTHKIATTFAAIFFDHQVLNFGIPTTVLTDIDPQFTSKLYDAGSNWLLITTLTTTEPQPQTQGTEELCNAATVSRPCHNTAEQQQERDSYVTPLTYA